MSLSAKVICKAGLGHLLLRPSAGLPVILMYHGVTDLPTEGLINASGKHVALELFKRQLRLLRSRRRVVPLSQLVERLLANEDASGMVAITFDDGYLNNAESAAPALEQEGMSATFFLASGFIARDRYTWTDRLEAALHAARPGEAEFAELPGKVQINGVDSRAKILELVKTKLKSLPWQEAEARVQEIESRLGVKFSAPSGVHRFMDWNSARQLAARGFELGAHTVNHAILSRLAQEDARREILDSRAQILAETGSCSETFCYPNGKLSDFNDETMQICRSDFAAAVSAEFGAVHPHELFKLRRIPVDGKTSVSDLASMIVQAN